MTDQPTKTAPDPRDRAIELLENRVEELETELDYWRARVARAAVEAINGE
jgi:hypothetical protein